MADKFKVGDRVRMHTPNHNQWHHKTGTIYEESGNDRWFVKYDDGAMSNHRHNQGPWSAKDMELLPAEPPKPEPAFDPNRELRVGDRVRIVFRDSSFGDICTITALPGDRSPWYMTSRERDGLVSSWERRDSLELLPPDSSKPTPEPASPDLAKKEEPMSTEPKLLAPGTRVVTKTAYSGIGGIEAEIVGPAKGWQAGVYEIKYLECEALEKISGFKAGQTSAWHHHNFVVREPQPKFKLGDRVTQSVYDGDWAAVVSEIRWNEKDKTWEYLTIYGDGSGSFYKESKLHPTDKHPTINGCFSYPKHLYEPPTAPSKGVTDGVSQPTPPSLTVQEQIKDFVKETPPMAAPSGVTPAQKLSNLVMELLQSERKELVASKDFDQAVTDKVAKVYKFDQEKFNALIKERVEKEVKEQVQEQTTAILNNAADGDTFHEKLAEMAEEKVEEWIENHLSDQVEIEVDKRADRAVDSFIESYDFDDKADDAVTEAAKEYDYSTAAEEALEEAAKAYDFDDKVQDIVNMLDFKAYLTDAFAHVSTKTVKEWIGPAVRSILEEMNLGSYLADKEMVELHAAQIAALVDQMNHLRLDYSRRERDLQEQVDKANKKMRSVEINCLPWWKRLWNRIR